MLSGICDLHKLKYSKRSDQKLKPNVSQAKKYVRRLLQTTGFSGQVVILSASDSETSPT